jgi:SSS family solute:Na+ symporter
LTLSLTAFTAYLGVQWWANWYPGQEPGGGGYLAQRMMSARDERHSVQATLWFTLAHYCLRPWPWIVAGLCALVLYPDLGDPEAGYALLIRDQLPDGCEFVAASMSTMSTQFNWGASYLVHDVYARFIRPEADDAHYVRVARITTLIIMVNSAGVTLYLDSIRQAWEFILEAGAGIGLVLILRWYWWRSNAWSEMTALVAPILGYAWLTRYTSVAFPDTLMVLVGWSTVSWLAVTWMTAPETDATLVAFYLRAHPGGPGWARIADLAGTPRLASNRGQVVEWIAGVILTSATLFGIGALVIPGHRGGMFLLALAVAMGTFPYRRFASRGWASLTT